MLARRGALPVKISTGNHFPRKIPEISTKLLSVLVLNFSDISALQYCTVNFWLRLLLCKAKITLRGKNNLGNVNFLLVLNGLFGVSLKITNSPQGKNNLKRFSGLGTPRKKLVESEGGHGQRWNGEGDLDLAQFMFLLS